MRITFLGTGTSHGVPMIGCACATCRSDDPRDRRWRPSIAIDLADGRRVLVDTSTDLRAQALRFGLTRIDAILFTHSHADHVLGLDDVRRFNVLQDGAIPCYGDADTLDDLRRIFRYVFDGKPRAGGGVPRLRPVTVSGPFTLGRQLVVPVPVAHGPRLILGYRFGPFAYLTDCNGIPEPSWPLLEGVRWLVLDALRDRPHPTHFTVDQAVDAARRIGAERTWFTHICHDLPHAATCARLPPGIELAYDGLVIDAADEPAIPTWT